MNHAQAETASSGRRHPGAAPSLALGVAIVMLSSAAPFLRFSDQAISVSATDVRDALLFVAAWIPFALAAVALSRMWSVRRPYSTRALLLMCIVLLPVVPPLHTSLFGLLQRLATSTDVPALSGIPFLMLTFVGALQYLVVVALVTAETSSRAADRARRAATDLQLSHAHLRQQLAEAHVSALRAQLQPHFLFNTLNSVSALVTSDPPAARRMLIDLSALLRSVLDLADEQVVPLERELELVRAYLAIQQVRFGDRLLVRFDVHEDVNKLPVPPMLLQPLAENAVHFAMRDDEVAVVLLRAHRTPAMLCIEVENSGPAPDHAGDSGGQGLGLRNTRDRLRHMYGEHAEVSLRATASGTGAVARLALPVSGPDK